MNLYGFEHRVSRFVTLVAFVGLRTLHLKPIRGNVVRNYMLDACIYSRIYWAKRGTGLLLTHVLATPTHPSNLYSQPCTTRLLVLREDGYQHYAYRVALKWKIVPHQPSLSRYQVSKVVFNNNVRFMI